MSSSLRFALIVLSYQVLRESLIFNNVGEDNFEKDKISDNELLFDKTNIIINLLITNIVEKTNRVVTKNTRSLRDYIINVYTVGAKEISKDSEEWNPIDKEGKFININKTSSEIVITFLESLSLEKILLSPIIPNVEELISMAKRVLNGEDKDFVYKDVRTISSSEINDILENNGYKKSRSTKDNNKVTKIKIPLVSELNSEEEEEHNE